MSNSLLRERKRQEWRQNPCPRCGAEAGAFCKNLDGSRRVSVHQDRRKRPNPLLKRAAATAPSVDRLDQIIVDAVVDVERLLRAQITHFTQRCESPIETLFAAATLLHREGARHLGVEMYHFGCPFSPEKRVSSWDSTDVYLQAQVGAYRVDLLFDDLCSGKRRFLVVELDGHDWHERTKEQASRDKKRDRALVAGGYRIMRFTGSEVYANPGECVQEVIEAILRARDDG